MLHRFKIHSALEFPRAALLGCHLAALRLRNAARWQIPILIACTLADLVISLNFFRRLRSSVHQKVGGRHFKKDFYQALFSFRLSRQNFI